MTTVEDLVSGHVASVQDALREAGERMRRVALTDTINASQRAVGELQEALAALSVALCDAEAPQSVDGTLESEERAA